MPVPTGLVYDVRCLRHDQGPTQYMTPDGVIAVEQHVENAERLQRTFELLERSGLLERLRHLPARAASREDLLRIHQPAYVDRVEQLCAGGGGNLGPSINVNADSWPAALLAAGGCLSAVDAIVAEEVRRAYCLIRPPGHHAIPGAGMGFCIFNNVAAAARYAQSVHGLGRIAIIDWDVHHGNGTQAIFWEDPSVLFISLHQDNLYPAGQGTLVEVGAAGAEGYTVNCPLPAGSGDHGYGYALQALVEPIVRHFGPDLIIVSAGQDPSALDPLGRMSVTAQGFRTMASRLATLADDVCGGRLLLAQEGGYSLRYMPICTVAVIEAVAGEPAAIQGDPWEPDVPRDVREWERRAVDAAVAVYRRWWPIGG